MEIEFLCPEHQVLEQVKLPDSYSRDFEGHIPCGGESKLPIFIRLLGSEVAATYKIGSERS